MPARIAATDAFKQITEVVGSGPFRFVADQYEPGNRAVFEKFAKYQPRDETPSGVAGGKQVYVDRVEWKIIPEAATAANALKAGEIDWLEMPLTDLLPDLRRDRNIVVGQLDPYGLYPVLRFNQLQGPTTKRAVRQAIIGAVDSREAMQAIMGDDTAAYHAPVGAFLPGTPYANDAGMDRLGPLAPGVIKSLLTSADYNGEKLVVMHPTDQPFYDAMTQVVIASLKKAGLNVDDQAMDWGTVVQRRGSKAPLDQGGWSMFVTSFPALDYVDPLSAPALRPAPARKPGMAGPTTPKSKPSANYSSRPRPTRSAKTCARRFRRKPSSKVSTPLSANTSNPPPGVRTLQVRSKPNRRCSGTSIKSERPAGATLRAGHHHQRKPKNDRTARITTMSPIM